MRTIAITSLIAVATAIQLQKSAMDDITEQVMADFDLDMDGDLNEMEFLDLMTYLDEDQSLTPAEKDWALSQYAIANPDCPIWLTDTISSAAGGEEAMAKLGKEDFMTLGTKLGGDDEELEMMWDMADWDDSGDLGLWEQDSVWASLMWDDEWECPFADCGDWECPCTGDWECPCTGDWECPFADCDDGAKTPMEEITDQVMADWDWDMDGDLNEDEFLGLMTYLDEDENLTPAEKEWALQQYAVANPECPIWLTDTISSAAGGEDAMADLGKDDFMTLGTKLGGEDDELEEMWDMADWDGNGSLDLWEQDGVWWSLMQDEDDWDCPCTGEWDCGCW